MNQEIKLRTCPRLNKNFKLRLIFIFLFIAIGWDGTARMQAATFPIISSSGQKIASVFDGLSPSQEVRDILVRRSKASGVSSLSSLEKPMLLPFVSVVTNASSCPTGGVCGQPGTTQGPAAPCTDGDCNVNNITDSDDPQDGTFRILLWSGLLC